MTIHETDVAEVSTGVQTVGGAELVIITTESGLYKIISKGAGAPPKITEEFFTRLPLAKAALERYENENASTVLKKKTMQEGIDRRLAALELENGELNNTVNGKEKKVGSRANKQTLPNL